MIYALPILAGIGIAVILGWGEARLLETADDAVDDLVHDPRLTALLNTTEHSSEAGRA